MRTCSIDECNDLVRARGYCSKHYQRHLHKGFAVGRTKNDPNEFVDCIDYWEIYLYDQQCNHVASAKIDSEDVEKCKQYKWYLNTKGYVISGAGSSLIWLHRFVMNVADHSVQVDHIHGNKFDYCKSQLRVCSSAQNTQNSKLYKSNTSGERNVYWSKRKGKWRVNINAYDKRNHFGFYDDYEEACQVARVERKRLHGEFTRE